MTPVSPASTRRDDDGSHDGQPANSPVSTLVSPVSQHGHHDREQHRDDNLPEVYVESSPQALLHESKQDARGHYAPDYANEKEALGDESDTHKLPVYSVPQDLNKLGPEAPGDFPPGAMADAERNPEPAAAPPKDERIMGLKRRTFFIVLVIVLIVVAAAVGGGVGGAVASSSNSDNDAGGATSTSDSPPSSTTSDNPSSTSDASEPEETIEFLTNQTEPEDTFAFQAWSDPNMDMDGNYTDVIVKRGPTNLNFTANSYIWKPNITNCCLSFCNTPHDVDPDWQCDERYRKKSSSSFKRIFVWCGLERLNENSKCSERGVDG